jgi:hypothetical protein
MTCKKGTRRTGGGVESTANQEDGRGVETTASEEDGRGVETTAVHKPVGFTLASSLVAASAFMLT